MRIISLSALGAVSMLAAGWLGSVSVAQARPVEPVVYTPERGIVLVELLREAGCRVPITELDALAARTGYGEGEALDYFNILFDHEMIGGEQATQTVILLEPACSELDRSGLLALFDGVKNEEYEEQSEELERLQIRWRDEPDRFFKNLQGQVHYTGACRFPLEPADSVREKIVSHQLAYGGFKHQAGETLAWIGMRSVVDEMLAALPRGDLVIHDGAVVFTACTPEKDRARNPNIDAQLCAELRGSDDSDDLLAYLNNCF